MLGPAGFGKSEGGWFSRSRVTRVDLWRVQGFISVLDFRFWIMRSRGFRV